MQRLSVGRRAECLVPRSTRALDGIQPISHGQARFALKGNGMRAYLLISGALFGVVALAHTLRLIQRWPIEVAGWALPMRVSVVGLMLTGALSFWAFRAASQAKR